MVEIVDLPMLKDDDFPVRYVKINVYQRVNPPRFHILSTIFPDPGWNPWPIDLASFRHPHAVTQTTGPRCVEG